MPARGLRVCLDARIPDGTHGGVQQVILGLAHGLASLPAGTEEYVFLVEPGQWEWLRPHLGGPCRPLEVRRRSASAWAGALRAAGAARLGALAARALGRGAPPGAPESDGTVERAGVDVVHLTLQSGFRTRLPTIYMPHDLLHVHLPELLPASERAAREAVYPDLCRRAACVIADSHWGREDLIRTYHLSPSRVRTVYLAPAIDAYPTPAPEAILEVRRRLGLPDAFALFPAQTWPHKNHRTLLDALALLRREGGPVVPLVLTGKEGRAFPEVRSRIDALGLADQVTSLGFLPETDVRAVYASARLLVYPSLFEGFGLPVLEAFRLGVPVASSRATSLPEVAGDAARLFDPTDARDLAEAIRDLWDDPVEREALVLRGRARAAEFTWSRTAATFRALYRMVGGRALDEGDRAALAGTGPDDARPC